MSGYRTAPLKTVVAINEQTLPESTPADFAFRYVDISAVGRGYLVAEPQGMRFDEAPSRARRLVRSGDTIMSTVRTYLRAVWPVSTADEPASLVVSTGFAVLTPRCPLDARFFSWFAQSDAFIESVVARSVGVSYPAINADDLGRFDVPLPSNDEQRAIVTFLDTETARIDALIAKKRRLIDLLDEREQRVLLDTVGDWKQVASRSLRQFGTLVFTGPFGTVLSANEYIEGGVPLINPTHIVRGQLEPDSAVTVAEHVAQRIQRHRLKAGDIVMGRKGDVGRSAIVPPEADGWLCGSDSIAIRCNRRLLDPEYLAVTMHVDVYRQQLAKHSTGATLANVNEPILLELRLPDLAVEEQQTAVAESRRQRQRRDRISGRLTHQINLLTEHRQALITAAVTGDIPIPGAAA